jgi:hypothetical protein
VRAPADRCHCGFRNISHCAAQCEQAPSGVPISDNARWRTRGWSAPQPVRVSESTMGVAMPAGRAGRVLSISPTIRVSRNAISANASATGEDAIRYTVRFRTTPSSDSVEHSPSGAECSSSSVSPGFTTPQSWRAAPSSRPTPAEDRPWSVNPPRSADHKAWPCRSLGVTDWNERSLWLDTHTPSICVRPSVRIVRSDHKMSDARHQADSSPIRGGDRATGPARCACSTASEILDASEVTKYGDIWRNIAVGSVRR